MKDRNQTGLHETNRYHDPAFPVGIYVVTPRGIEPEGRGYRDLHWHEELQFTWVAEGTLRMNVNAEEYEIQKGEAIFINRNQLHVTTHLMEGGKYISLNFPDKLLGFFPGSRMEQKDVLPFTVNSTAAAMLLRRSVGWQREILDILEEILQLLAEPEEQTDSMNQRNQKEQSALAGREDMAGQETSADRKGRDEYRIALLLTWMWYRLTGHLRAEINPPGRSYLRRQQRVQSMLSFIHENYMNDIRLEDLAALEHVSVGECCRCFRRLVRMSPNHYLMEYRLARSMELLNTTDLNVTEIAFRVGFNDSSHFIQSFKNKEGITPGKYREGKC